MWASIRSISEALFTAPSPQTPPGAATRLPSPSDVRTRAKDDREAKAQRRAFPISNRIPIRPDGADDRRRCDQGSNPLRSRNPSKHFGHAQWTRVQLWKMGRAKGRIRGCKNLKSLG